MSHDESLSSTIMSDPQSPPPAYEISQQDFDRKTSEALVVSHQTEEEQWEIWDEAAFSAASGQVADNSNAAASSSGADAPQYQYPANPSKFAADLQPLNIHKKAAMQSKAKERPSWYEEAGLGDSASSSALRPVETERLSSREAIGGSNTLRSPHELSAEDEADNAISPPPFTEVAPEIQPTFQPEIQQPSPVVSYHGNGSAPPSPLSSPVVRVTPLPTPPPPPPLIPAHVHLQGRSSPQPPPSRQSLPAPRRHYTTTAAPRPTTSIYGRGELPTPPAPRMSFDPSVAYERKRGDAQPRVQLQFQSPAYEYESFYK
jgi:hypothetical protein